MESKQVKDFLEAYSSIYEKKEEPEMEECEEKEEEGEEENKGKKKEKEEKGEKEEKEDKKEMKESVDLFDYILEYLIDEGYADTNKAAIAIMANMSEEWKKNIIEEVDPIDVDFKPQRLPNGRMPKPTPQQAAADVAALKLRARARLKGV